MIVYIISHPEDDRLVITTVRSTAERATSLGTFDVIRWDTEEHPTKMFTFEMSAPQPHPTYFYLPQQGGKA